MSETVFVTGATGVVGRRLVPLLMSAGHTVTALGRRPDQRAALERQGARAVAADLFDPKGLAAAVAGHDAIVNLATHMPASTSRLLVPGAWKENDRVRRQGSSNLVDAALGAGVARFVQESFAPVYPDRGVEWIAEDTPIQPTRYNRTVADAERSAIRFTTAGNTGVVLRFAGFYGPDSPFLIDMIRLVRRGWVPLPGKPEAFVSSVSHDDAAAAALAALALPPGAYNVSDDEPVTRREYFDTLAAALGVARPRFAPAWTFRLLGSTGELLARSERISNRKLRAASSWAPRYRSVREGWPDAVAGIEAKGRTAA